MGWLFNYTHPYSSVTLADTCTAYCQMFALDCLGDSKNEFCFICCLSDLAY